MVRIHARTLLGDDFAGRREYRGVAQMAEHPAHNQEGDGSIPSATTPAVPSTASTVRW